MIVEAISVLAIMVGGCALLRTLGITGWPLPALGFIAGTALQVVIGMAQVFTPLPTTPILTLALTAGAPLVWYAARAFTGHDVALPLVPSGAVLVVLALLVLLFRRAHLVNWHTDTFRYLMVGNLIANGNYHEAMTTDLLTKRLLSMPLIHAPANLGGQYYLRSVVPLLAIATVMALVWFFREGLRDRLSPGRIALLCAAGVLLLVSMNRFVFHAFYLNGHLLFATLVLVIAGSGWLLLTTDRIPAPALLAMSLLAIPALVVTRAEASLVAILALLPVLLSGRIDWRHRAALLGALGASILAWQAYVAVRLWELDLPEPISVTAELGLGLALLAAIPLLRWRQLTDRRRLLLWSVEAVLWLALLALAVREPDVLRDSLAATAENVLFGAGSWGLALVMLTFLVLLALTRHSPGLEQLRFPVTTFLPLAFLLPFLREGAYRVGDGDSLNRMLIQVVPLAVLYVIAAAGTRRRFTPGAATTESEPTASPDGDTTWPSTPDVALDDERPSASPLPSSSPSRSI